MRGRYRAAAPRCCRSSAGARTATTPVSAMADAKSSQLSRVVRIGLPHFTNASVLRTATLPGGAVIVYTRESGEGGNNSVVECDLAKVEVAGSNPVSRSKFVAGDL
jgi:hypothetical protein